MATCKNEGIRLSLTAEEAEALHGLLGEMTVGPESDPDKALDRVWKALDNAGVCSPTLLVDGWHHDNKKEDIRVRWAK